MYSNIFEIWKHNKKKVPFAVRKMSWSDPNVFAIITKVVPDDKGYGTAYGYPTTNGILNDYFEYDPDWKKHKHIPVSGCRVWQILEDIEIVESEGGIIINKVNAKKAKATKTKRNSTYTFDTMLTFGKYKGKTIKEVVDINPGYLKWAVSNIEGFNLTPEIVELIEK